jgi:two-component system, NtrC family, sensor kinase
MRHRGASEQPVKRRRSNGLKGRKASTAVPSIADLQEQVGALTRELKEAREQQTAAADVLKVISGSAFELGHVFHAVVDAAVRLCHADQATIYREENGEYRWAADHALSSDYARIERNVRIRPSTGTLVGRVALSRDTVQILDAWTDPLYEVKEDARVGGVHTMLGVPLLRDGLPIGVIGLARQRIESYTEEEIALVRTFADQAVIAIENARLFNETKEALDRQTATADILKVIASSPSDVQPVFEAIVNSAARLFDPCAATITTLKEGILHFNATAALQAGFNIDTARSVYPLPFDPDRAPSARAMLQRRIIEIPDTASPDTPEFTRRAASAGGFRSIAFVPLIHQDKGIGTIILTHPHAGFRLSEKQLALVQTFADQAAIAIQNVKLFDEVQAKTRNLEESLQQQTATSEVLEVISSSPGELGPVFDKMLENATRICGAEFGSMSLVEDDSVRQAALYNAPVALVAARANKVSRLHPQSSLATAIRNRQVVQVADLRTSPTYREHWPSTVELVELGGARTIVVVPMLRESKVIGLIVVYRQEVRAFGDKQMDLLTNFARQAVIAIENARLLGELRQRTADLSKSLDDLRTAQDRLIQTEKLASLGQLTAGIAHEIKNPLNFVNNFSALSIELTDELNDLLRQAVLAEKLRGEVDELTSLLRDNLCKVVQHGRRADSIVKNMLLHSREGSGERRSVDVNAMVGESLNLAYHGARAEKAGFSITLKHDLDPEAGALEMYPQEMTRALLNLISNGFYAATRRKIEAGEEAFEPVLSASTRNLGKTVEIRIRDNGIGIPPEVRDKMFNPFFTTKPTGEGTGLGLSMTHDIVVKQHGGRIDVETEPGVFTEFIITLPRDNRTHAGEELE